MAKRKIYLSKSQLSEFLTVSESISEDEMLYYYTLSEEDIQLALSHRGDDNRLGFAMTLCCIRHKGWPYSVLEAVPEKVISFVAGQLGVKDLTGFEYGRNKNTRANHLSEICSCYGYRQEEAWYDLNLFAKRSSHRLNDIVSITKEVICYSISHKIIPPKVNTIARWAHDAVSEEEERVFASVSSSLSKDQKKKLDDLMDMEGGRTSGLFEIKDVSGRWNSNTFNQIADKIERLNKIKVPEVFKDIHPNLLKSFSKMAFRYTPFRFRRFSDDKRHALLAILVHQQHIWLTDMAIDLNDKILNNIEQEARNEASCFLVEKKDEIGSNYRYFHKLGEGIYSALVNGNDMREAVESLTTIDELRSKLDSRYTPNEGDKTYFERIISKYHVLKRYVPSMLRNITFDTSISSSKELIKALYEIKEMYEKKKTSLPAGVPTSFLNDEWKFHVKDNGGNIKKDAYLVALMLELRRLVRSGDVWVKNSYKYSSLESMLVSEDEIDYKALNVDQDFSKYLESRGEDMKKIYRSIESDLESFSKLKRKDNRLHPERLDNSVPDGVRLLNSSLYSIMPRVSISDMIFEVDKWTGFMQNFTHLSTGTLPQPKDIPVIAAALTAMGTNIGIQKMSECSEDVNYANLFTISNWRLYDDTLKRAQSTLVNFQHHLPLARVWGDGSTSSSDGMRVVCGVRSLLASHNPHYGAAQGVTMYRHTSDEYSAFYVNVINTNVRDAVHVIDGILHHESDLNIEKHYTDTAGYTDQIFGLSHLLGFMFAPRIRDISDCILYALPETSIPYALSDIDMRHINIKLIEEHYKEVLRIAYSIKAGYVSCDMVMSRLGSYSRQNALAKALTEMGRIEKTIFILKYLTDAKLRREILIGLNKGEAMNGLARAVFFGKSGNLREKDLHDQLQRASCLNILLNIVVIWNTVYLSKAIEFKRGKGELDESLLSHISPLNWNHIQLYGKYSFNAEASLGTNQYRQLRVDQDNGQ